MCDDDDPSEVYEEDPEVDDEDPVEEDKEDLEADPRSGGDDKIRPQFAAYLDAWNYLRFDGSRQGADAQDFLERLREQYYRHQCTPAEGAVLAEHCLVGDARTWWLGMRGLVQYLYQGDTWWQFIQAFEYKYVGQEEIEAVKPEPVGTTSEERVDKISGTITVNGHPAYALFDPGATHSYVDNNYATTWGLPIEYYRESKTITYADGSEARTSRVCRDCRLMVGGMHTKAELILSKIEPTDVLLGMDWLGDYYAHIDCQRGEIEFRVPGQPTYKFLGDRDPR